MSPESAERRAFIGDWGTDVEELFSRLRLTGDRQAREELVRRFLPLARKLAGRYTNPYEPFEDLVQVASIGLLGAIDALTPTEGSGFRHSRFRRSSVS